MADPFTIAMVVVAVVSAAFSYVQARKMADQEGAGTEITRFGTNQDIPVVYGTRKMSPIIVYQGVGEKTFSNPKSNNQYYWAILVWAQECDDITEFQCDGLDYTDFGNWETGETQTTDNKLAVVHRPAGGAPPDWFTRTTGNFPACPDSMTNVLGQGLAITYIRLHQTSDFSRFPSGRPEFTAIIKGRKVLNLETGVTEHTDNFAYCLYDAVTNDVFGAGQEMDQAQTVLMAQFCDEEVEDGDGEMRRQMTCNYAWDTGTEVTDNLDDMRQGCRGFFVESPLGLRLEIDRQRDVDLHIGIDDIIGGIEASSIASSDRYNSVTVNFADADNDYADNSATFPDADSGLYEEWLAEDNGIEMSQDTDMPTITNYYEALQYAEIVARLSRDMITAEVTVKNRVGLRLEEMDVVTLDSQLRGWDAKPFSVSQITYGVSTVDLVLTEYQETIYPWTAKPPAPEFADTTLPNPFLIDPVEGLAFTETPNDSAYAGLLAWDESESFNKGYKVVLRRQEEPDVNVWEYVSGVNQAYLTTLGNGNWYFDVYVIGAYGLSDVTTLAFTTLTPSVQNLTYNAATSDVNQGELTWDDDWGYADGYIVEIADSTTGNVIVSTTVAAKSYIINLVPTGHYTISVWIKTISGNVSAVAAQVSTSLTWQNYGDEPVPPLTPTGIEINTTSTTIELIPDQDEQGFSTEFEFYSRGVSPTADREFRTRARTYTEINLQPDTIYFFSIRSVNNAGVSAWFETSARTLVGGGGDVGWSDLDQDLSDSLQQLQRDVDTETGLAPRLARQLEESQYSIIEDAYGNFIARNETATHEFRINTIKVSNDNNSASIERIDNVLVDQENALAETATSLSAQIIIGDEATEASANEYTRAAVGYCVDADGNVVDETDAVACIAVAGNSWVSGPLAEYIRDLTIELADGSYGSVKTMGQVFQTDEGQTIARGTMITDVNGYTSGVVNVNNGERSSLSFIADETAVGTLEGDEFDPLLFLDAADDTMTLRGKLVLDSGFAIDDASKVDNSVAADDATAKAAAAQAAAEAHADAEINLEAVRADAYADGVADAAELAAIAAAEAAADAAEFNAKAHADGEITASEAATQAAYEAYADAAANLAETTASAYADGVADAAELAAIAAAEAAADAAEFNAKAHADGEITASEAATQAAYETYADAAANLAETTASAYADGIVSEEEARAIADATAKADAAEAAAIAAAATDATNKANAAEQAAKEASDPLGSAADAQSNAKAFTEGRIYPHQDSTVIQSATYEPGGEDGFSLDADGNAEFNNAVIRGVMRSGQVEMVGTGFMKVTAGGSFGPDDLIEWYGPRLLVNGYPDYDSLSKSNAIYYLSNDGDAYFGGSLSAGVLHNAAQSTSVLPAPEIVVGPFGTNGNNKTVVVSISRSTWSFTAGGGGGGETDEVSCTITLYRAIGAGSYTAITSRNFTGAYTKVVEGTDVLETEWLSGSFTLTDNSPSTENFTYKAVVTAYDYRMNPADKQSLSLSSTEE